MIENLEIVLPTAFLVAKGIAAVLVNNLDTQDWGKFGQLLEWLASANKKAKLTGDPQADTMIKSVTSYIPAKTVVGKLLRLFS